MASNSGSEGTMSEYKKLFVTFGVILVLLGGFILYLSWPLLTGKTIILATRPVDPFDIFRGQYITIGYEINQVPAIDGVNVGDVMYVLVQKDEGGIWGYLSATGIKPSDDVFLRGIVRSVGGGSMQLEYGIEQFFFEKGAHFPGTNMTVEVKVDSSGKARIVQLLHNGEPLNITYRDVTLTS